MCKDLLHTWSYLLLINLVTAIVSSLLHKMRRARLTKENGAAKGSGQWSQDPNPGHLDPIPSCHPPSHPP